jgi:RNA polymerase-binding transcription factor DksA
MKKKETTNEAGLTGEQLLGLQRVLEGARAAVIERRAARLAVVSDGSTEVMDEGDSAARDDAERTLVSLAENERVQLARIEVALRRLHQPDFGLDVETGEPIGYARLLAVPWATRAVQQEEKFERAARAAA